MCHTTAVLSKKPSCLSGASLQIPRAISSILHSDEMRWISDTHRVWKVTSANCIICSQGPLQNRQTGGHSWCFLWLHAGDWSKNQEKKIARRFLWVIRWPAVPLRICTHRSSFSYASRCPERHVQFESQHVPSGGIHQNTSKMDNTYPPAKLTSKCIYVNVYIGSSRLLELPKPWGKGVGWDVNVHVNLRQQLMLRTRGVGGGWGGMLTFMWTCGRMLTFMWTCGSSWCYAHAGWGGWGGMLTFMWTCGSMLTFMWTCGSSWWWCDDDDDDDDDDDNDPNETC